MKKSTCFLAIVLIICMLTIICTSCIFKDYATNETENLFKDATYTTLDGTKTNISKKQNANEGIIVKLPNAKQLNTIVLGESKQGLKSNITKFSLSYLDHNSNEWIEFYEQDLVEQYRYCVFNKITADQIKLTVKETEQNRKWNLKKFTGHFVEKTAKDDFRIMGYAVAGYGYKEFKDPSIFDTVTHINMFQHLRLKEDGTVYFTNKNANGGENENGEINGEDFFKQELINTVNAIGDRNTKIILTILPQGGQDPEALHTAAFEHNSKKIIDTINEIYEKYPEVDGIAFDYEYPYSGKANKVFGNFVKELKTNMPENKQLALALSSWQFKVGLFPHSALEYVDMVEMMAYDQFDERGYHSTFQNSMVNIVEELHKLNLDKYLSKINLGVPFYSRPADGSLYWGDYNIDAKSIGKSNNIVKDLEDTRHKVITWDPYVEEPMINPVLYYNSPQMIYDKTAYAIDNNIGGMMIWHLGCDVTYDDDYSLLKTMQKAIDSRK